MPVGTPVPHVIVERLQSKLLPWRNFEYFSTLFDHKFFERLDEFLFVFLDVFGELLLLEILCLYAFGFFVDG